MKNAIVRLAILISTSLSMNLLANAGFEERPLGISKTYATGNEVGLECVGGASSCDLRVQTKFKSIRLKVPFKQWGVKPALDTVSMFMRDNVEVSATIRTGVECGDKQIEWAEEVDAFRVSCYVIFNIERSRMTGMSIEAVEAIASGQSRIW